MSTIHEILARGTDESPPASSAGAAVTLVLRRQAGDVEVLLIQRTDRDDDRASGQVGLPGGHVERQDANLRATAVRELHEEVGLGPEDVIGTPRFLGIAPAPVFSLQVGLFVVEWRDDGRPPTARSAEEVARAFWLPARALQEERSVVRSTPHGPREVDAVVFEGHVLWGFTRRVLRVYFGLEAAPEGWATAENHAPNVRG